MTPDDADIVVGRFRILGFDQARSGVAYATTTMLRVSEIEIDGLPDLRWLPSAILLDDTRGGAHVQRAGAALAVLEARLGARDGEARVVAEIASGAGLLVAGSLPGSSPRLGGVAWDGERLARDLGGRVARDPDGAWRAPLLSARTTALATAAAARTPAIDAPYPAAGQAAFAQEAEAAQADGFAQKVATGAEQAAAAAKIFR